MKLSVKAAAIAGSILWGVGLFLITWWIIMLEGVSGDVTFVGRLYPGYNISPEGSVIGLLWALVDGALFGALFAWLYNRFLPQAERDSDQKQQPPV